MIPEGWLIDPKRKWLLLFRKDPASLQRLPKVFMDKWESTSLGSPSTFKNRRKVDLTPAIETWNELIDNGWIQVEFNDDLVA
ncbi:DUF1651 domain-containing protein [Prochlorococcus marinus]|uniref:DUF1651 domain-containing protein n=1 Tax=Prochlorococcus marinus TaxID=1219 RepID=UPI0022B37592|nr:DUF1651 domain-containing protein [Prochlorococcus marinus]